MSLSLGDRLGILGVFLALMAPAVSILWPDKKWVGWLSLIGAVFLLIGWGWLEFGRHLPRLRVQYPILSTVAVFVVGGCLAAVLWRLTVPKQLTSEQQAVTPNEEVDKVAEETKRRGSLFRRLQQEYFLSHDSLTPAELAGTEVTRQEAEWINGRLKQKGEIWKVAPTTPAGHVAIEPLKQTALLLANRIQIFSTERDTVWNGVYAQLKFGTLTEEDQKSNQEKRDKFAKDNRELFDQRFRKEASQMVEEFRTKGLDTTVAARALNPTVPNFFSIMEFVNALRGLAAQIDDNGKLIQ